jgi:hypothetical protein
MLDLGGFLEGVTRGRGGGWVLAGRGGGGETTNYLLQKEGFNYDTGPL